MMRRTNSEGNFQLTFFKSISHNMNCERYNIVMSNQISDATKIKKLNELIVKIEKHKKLDEKQKMFLVDGMKQSIEKINKEIEESKKIKEWQRDPKIEEIKEKEDELQFNMEI